MGDWSGLESQNTFQTTSYSMRYDEEYDRFIDETTVRWKDAGFPAYFVDFEGYVTMDLGRPIDIPKTQEGVTEFEEFLLSEAVNLDEGSFIEFRLDSTFVRLSIHGGTVFRNIGKISWGLHERVVSAEK